MPGITFYCPNKIAERIKAEAISQGTSVSKQITEIIQQHYGRWRKREAAEELKEMLKFKGDEEIILKEICKEREESDRF